MNVIAIYACVLRGVALFMLLEAIRDCSELVERVQVPYGRPLWDGPVLVGLSAILAGALWIFASELAAWALRSQGHVADALRAGMLPAVVAAAPVTIAASLIILNPDNQHSWHWMDAATNLHYSRLTMFGIGVFSLLFATPIGQFFRRLDRRPVT